MVTAVRHLGPNWYASVMGTAVLATAGAGLPAVATGTGLPGHAPGLRSALDIVWALSLVLLVALLAARALHWRHHPDQARADLLDVRVAPFHGCTAMGFLAVAGATLAVGGDWIGARPAVLLAGVLFAVGTVLGLVVAVAIPCLTAARHRPSPAQAAPAWLLPLVAPMVSAAVGPLFVPRLPPGQPRQTLLLGCLALFGLSLFAVLVVLPVIVARLLTHEPLPMPLTPTLFLVLGPLGQSTTAVGKIADMADAAGLGSYTRALTVFSVLYGVPVMGFALLWLLIAGAATVRARRRGMGFSLAWWGYTFPVGTCVTGATALGRHTGLAVYDALAVLLELLLVAAWAAASWHTGRGLVSRELLAGPAPEPRGADLTVPA